MQQSRLMVLGSVLLAAAFSVPVWGADPAQPGISKVDSPRPGSVNYVEGEVSLNSRLDQRNPRFGTLREFSCKPLIYLTIFTKKWQFFRPDRENSRLHGNNRELGLARLCGA